MPWYSHLPRIIHTLASPYCANWGFMNLASDSKFLAIQGFCMGWESCLLFTVVMYITYGMVVVLMYHNNYSVLLT